MVGYRAMLLCSTTLVKTEKPGEAKRLREGGQGILEKEINPQNYESD